MLFILGTLLLFIISIRLSAVLSVGFLMLHFKVKRHLQKMTEEKWQEYFHKIGSKGVFFRIIGYYWMALLLLAYWNMIYFWNDSAPYAITLLLAGAFHLFYKYRTKKQQFQKIIKQQFDSSDE